MTGAWTDKLARRLGHGPWGPWPLTPWRKLFYDPRPDIITSKTRAPEWRKLMSDWRFFQALFPYFGPPSHLLWNVKWPFLAVMVVAVSMCLHQHFRGISESGAGPLVDFILSGDTRECAHLSSFAMSLMLSFRVRRAYDRWNLARASLAGVGNGTTTIFMLASSWIDNPQLVDEFRRFCIVWPFAIWQVCINSKTLDPRAAALLEPEELAIYSKSRKGRQVVVTKMRQLASEANLTTEQFIAMETAIAATWKSAGDALRIRFQAMPHGLSLLCTGFIMIWCLMLPVAIWNSSTDDAASWMSLLGIAVVTMLLLGCDEMANQMEEAFSLIPMEDIFVTYDRDINRVYDEQKQLREAAAIIRARQASKLRSAEHKASALLEVTENTEVHNHQHPTTTTSASMGRNAHNDYTVPTATQKEGPMLAMSLSSSVRASQPPAGPVIARSLTAGKKMAGGLSHVGRQALLQDEEREHNVSDAGAYKTA